LTAAPPQVTREDCLKLLQGIMADPNKGSAVVASLLQQHGGTAMFKDVPDEKLPAVYQAAVAAKG
jgi:hypothetical protein